VPLRSPLSRFPPTRQKPAGAVMLGPVTAGSAIGPTTVPILAIPTPITLIGADAIGAAGIIVKRLGNNDRFEELFEYPSP
jgi:hypothetical protein